VGMILVDLRKASHTPVAAGADEQPLGQVRVVFTGSSDRRLGQSYIASDCESMRNAHDLFRGGESKGITSVTPLSGQLDDETHIGEWGIDE
jgi:hypothetical protein